MNEKFALKLSQGWNGASIVAPTSGINSPRRLPINRVRFLSGGGDFEHLADPDAVTREIIRLAQTGEADPILLRNF